MNGKMIFNDEVYKYGVDLALDLQVEYFNWLVSLVPCPDTNHRSWRKLLAYFMDQEFTWMISKDENRAGDGISLRDQFIYEKGYRGYSLPDNPCTLLEFFIGLSRRANDIMATAEVDSLGPWFWVFMFNLSLDYYDDEIFDEKVDEIEEKIGIFLDRKYDYSGYGGVFPLENPRKDQRKVEIWYQLNDFLGEFTEYME